ncbi:MAG: ImmA/IrrE family metallo-endopeptidase [Candidatus Eremiobacteraeota bacterium]|nr:ImmA/IrrE family metallo-endopeptidase [Candidatus Eremiobacteraeota bacterium]MCD4784872.1 ImmA/IrrE family metallo-endopeptidase [Candidatus Eremiobacteraeota bacterium]
MSVKVPFLHLKVIEDKAELVIQEYNLKFPDAKITEPPVPIENIIEALFELYLEIDNLRKKLGNTDVLGALFRKDRKISIDESVVEQEGRYHYTCAHELGHWVLHRDYLNYNENQLTFFDNFAQPSIICRSSMYKEPVERQADKFAANLLMPKKMICKYIHEKFGSIDDFRRHYNKNPAILNNIVFQMKNLFRVSKQAMRIRIEELKLLKNSSQISFL